MAAKSVPTDAKRTVRDLVVVRQPLQPWSRRYRTDDDPRLFTFALRHLDAVFDSHLVGYEKPDPRIFEHALVHLGASAADTPVANMAAPTAEATRVLSSRIFTAPPP